MGIVFSDFFRKKTNAEKLELVFYQMQLIEEYKTLNKLRRKKVLSAFTLYSFTCYFTAIVAVYLYFFPDRFKYQAFLVTGFISVPFLIFALKNFLSWYYEKKLSSNESKLVKLRNKRNELVDVIKKTETYAKAKEILNKFAPNEDNNETSSNLSRTYSNPDLTSQADAVDNLTTPLLRGLYTRNVNRNAEPNLLNSTMYGTRPQLVNQSPYPIISPTKSFFETVINALVGDRASDRFALICKKCSAHNGMALSEEFEYTSFRCCFCYTLNASRKQRPTGLKLEETNFYKTIDDPKNKSMAAGAATAGVKHPINKNETHDSDDSENQQNCNEAAGTKNNNKNNRISKDKSQVQKNTTTDEN